MKGNSFKSIFYLLYIINVNTFFRSCIAVQTDDMDISSQQGEY